MKTDFELEAEYRKHSGNTSFTRVVNKIHNTQIRIHTHTHTHTHTYTQNVHTYTLTNESNQTNSKYQ